MRRIRSPCCAPAPSGHAAEPPSSVMNWRRLMPDIGLPPASALPVYRTLNLPQRGRKVLGPDLKCSEAGLGAAGRLADARFRIKLPMLRLGQFRLDQASSLLQGSHLFFRRDDNALCERRKQWLKSLVSVDRKHPVVFPVVPEH